MTDGTGLTPLSYWTYLQDIVNRYKSSPALGMWEPISEAEASTCPAQYQPTNCSGHQTCPNETAAAASLGLASRGVIPSPITGAEGNVELLAAFRRNPATLRG